MKKIDSSGMFGDHAVFISKSGEEQFTQRDLQFIWRMMEGAEVDEAGREICQKLFGKIYRALHDGKGWDY